MILEDMGRISNASADSVNDYISSYGPEMFNPSNLDTDSVNAFINVLSRDLLRWQCPGCVGLNPPDSDLKTMPRSKEPPKWKCAIKECAILFQLSSEQRLFLLKARRKMSLASALKIRTKTASNPKLPNDPNIVYATFNGQEKN